MAGICKNLVRFGIIGGLALGGLALIAGPSRISALLNQVRGDINAKIDENITDPVAIRAQLKDLEATYPQRIADVRGDLAELREQTLQLKRDLEVSNRVVTLADDDLDKLDSALAQAEASSIQAVSTDGAPRRIVIVFNEDRLSVEDAYGKRGEVTNTRNAYASRASDIQRDLGYMSQQETRLTELLAKLEQERASFQTQLWDIDRQVDAVARNTKMIDILQDRQESIDEQSRYRAASLDQIKTRLADVRARQEAKLEMLAGDHRQSKYEDAAKASLDRDLAEGARVSDRNIRTGSAPKENVLEIRPSKNAPSAPEDEETEIDADQKPGTVAKAD